MTGLEAGAAALAAGMAAAVALALPRRPDSVRTKPARFLLWFALAAALPFLLLHPLDRPTVHVSGVRGTFEATRLLALAAAAAALALTGLEVFAGRHRPQRAWSVALLLLVASLAGAVLATARVL